MTAGGGAGSVDGAGTFFSAELLGWYRKEKRDLPWRRSRDPYPIWVSEIMLQQTRVDTVIPYFERFMERFPTIAHLAAAPEADVLKAWEGLGYYSRARNLQAAARQVAEQHGGAVPRDKASVSALKGVGPYTAGAILSIAFDEPEPAVDGNVMRVLSRFFNLDDDIAKPSVRVGMEQRAKALIPEGEAASFNQALMELGALVCTPRSPGCLSCPVMERCAGRLAGRERELPVKTKAKPPKPVFRLAVLIEGTGAAAGRVLVRQRPAEGLLARLWELPHVEAPNESVWASGEAAADWLAGSLAAEGVSVRPLRHVGDAEHIFSHLHWYVKVWSAELLDEGSVAATATVAETRVEESAAAGLRVAESGNEYGVPGADGRPGKYLWIDREQFRQLAWPNVFRKMLGEYFGV